MHKEWSFWIFYYHHEFLSKKYAFAFDLPMRSLFFVDAGFR